MKVSASFTLQNEPEEGTLWPLFFVSFASLYIEMLLIRWIGTEVRVFAYFQNLALIACFVGFGVGCYRSRGKKKLFSIARPWGVLSFWLGCRSLPGSICLPLFLLSYRFRPTRRCGP